MRKALPLVLLVALLVVSCSPSTPTHRPVCTPPDCAEGEVYYCPDDCPGGCGTECATPTPGGPPAAPTVAVTKESESSAGMTQTPMPVCTPPNCAEGEVYYCPGECPGGCGTICATPTPGGDATAPASTAAPAIVSFTAEPTAIVEGDEVTFSWEATGGAEAWIQWTDRFGILQAISVDPDGGSQTFIPDNGRINLLVENSAGADSATVELDITCANEWAPPLAENPPIDVCPSEAQVGPAAQQPFENGLMIWFGPSDTIFVMYDEGQLGAQRPFDTFEDTFEEGDPESDSDIVPPDGLYQPVRGFGLIWRENPVVREQLGWATAPEAGFETWRQSYSARAMHASANAIQGIDGTVYVLEDVGGTWEVYEP
jgi:hypothetical protein